MGASVSAYIYPKLYWIFAPSERIFAFVMTTIDQFFADFEKKLDLDLLRRVKRVAKLLEQELKKLYGEEFRASRGQRGVIGSITSDVRLSSDEIKASVGAAKAGNYLKYLEEGVQPYPGAKHPAMKKPPPVGPIYRWLRTANIPLPDKFRKAKNPGLSFSYAIAQSIMKKGRPALRIIELTLSKHRDTITKIIAGKA